MKLKTKIIYIAILLLAYSCSPKGDGTVSTVEVNGSEMLVVSFKDIKPDTISIPLSSLVENCSLVQLETKDEAFFNPWFTTVTEKYIGVRDFGIRPYKLFDHSGKFLCDIGSIGQGPGEYSLTLYDDVIDEKNELIYLTLVYGNQIYVYNTSGEFVKYIVSPQRLQKPKIFLSDNILTVVHMPMKNEYASNLPENAADAIVIQFDVNTGQILKELAPSDSFIVPDFDSEIFNTRNLQGINDL